MHGLIFAELKKYAESKYGTGAWQTLQSAAQVTGKLYLTSETYPDGEAVALVGAASSVTGRSVPELLEEFGEFIVPDLMRLYRADIPDGWDGVPSSGVIDCRCELWSQAAASSFGVASADVGGSPRSRMDVSLK